MSAQVTSATGTPAGAQRRRGAELEASILDAVWAELAEVGYARLTMEGVAARAQTGKQVLYRRWPNRAQLVIAAVRHVAGSIIEDVPDTGSLREDVLTVLRRMARRQQDVGPELIHGLLAEASDVAPDVLGRIGNLLTTVLARAAERGEIGPAAVHPRIVSLPSNLLRHELLLTRDPVTEDVLVEIVDEVFLPLIRSVSPVSPVSPAP